ncbi:hypothetical protein RRG08_028744 [Elysia crispata]|uniref:G-protein coupled receptors family 1 profile domain-containing protein n=1 Tax=Elysia crispata TaxID=231223 RepID=A0AAE0ZN46_9GAST|nr:hypothetical protein RRG08_028744 [Elysia crispata]
MFFGVKKGRTLLVSSYFASVSDAHDYEAAAHLSSRFRESNLPFLPICFNCNQPGPCTCEAGIDNIEKLNQTRRKTPRRKSSRSHRTFSAHSPDLVMEDNSTVLAHARLGPSANSSGPPSNETSLQGTVLLSLLFSAIFFVGIAGNLLVIAVIVRDSKMRQSVTNLMIINLAIADLVVMFLNVPEMVMFVMGGAWILGPVACRTNRFIMTSGLYCSVLSLLALCVERRREAWSEGRERELISWDRQHSSSKPDPLQMCPAVVYSNCFCPTRARNVIDFPRHLFRI